MLGEIFLVTFPTWLNVAISAKNMEKFLKLFQLQSISVPSEVMKQIGIDICNLPEVDRHKHLIVCIDYFSKWSVKDKSAETGDLLGDLQTWMHEDPN